MEGEAHICKPKDLLSVCSAGPGEDPIVYYECPICKQQYEELSKRVDGNFQERKEYITEFLKSSDGLARIRVDRCQDKHGWYYDVLTYINLLDPIKNENSALAACT